MKNYKAVVYKAFTKLSAPQIKSKLEDIRKTLTEGESLSYYNEDLAKKFCFIVDVNTSDLIALKAKFKIAFGFKACNFLSMSAFKKSK